MQSIPKTLETDLAAVGLGPTDVASRSYVPRLQGKAIILLQDARGLRVTARKVFGLPRRELRAPMAVITLPSAPLSALEEAASEVVGGQVSVAGIRLGAGSLRKLTVGFVERQRPVAFAKFPLTQRAVGSLAHELETIGSLAGFGPLSGHLPDVISDLDLGGIRGTLFSAGPVRRVRRPGKNVASFLSALHQLTTRKLTIQASGLTDSWLENLESHRELLQPERSSTLEIAVQRVQDQIGLVPIDHTTAHGDFTRWNLRQGKGGLFVFDWEASVTPALPYHDLFHYFAANAALSHRPGPTSYVNRRRIRSLSQLVSKEWIPLQHTLYLSYLIETTLWYTEFGDWHSRAQPGRFWRFLWTELVEMTKAR